MFSFGYLVPHALNAIIAVASVLMAVRLLASRRTPQSILAWVLALFFMPLVAIPLYFLLGTRKLPAHARTKPVPAADKVGTIDVAFGPIPRVLRAAGVPPIRTENAFELLETGEQAFARLLEMIEGAKRSVHLTMFILGDDATGWLIVDALQACARRGIEMSVVLDAVGSSKIMGRARYAIEAAGGKLLAFMPLIHAPLRGRSNLRSHRKLLVVDGWHVFLGGMNLAEEYMGPQPTAKRWRDVAAVVSGPVGRDAEVLFASDWAFCGGLPASASALPADADDPVDARGATACVQLVPSGPDMKEDTFYDAVLTAIFSAQTRVCAVTPYYVPDDFVQRALVLAARRGVQTQLVLPAKSNHSVADFARCGLLRELATAGVDLRFFSTGMLHAKAMLVDDRFAYVGSANLDMRSLFLNYESTLCVYSPREVDAVRRWVDQLLGECSSHVAIHTREHPFVEQIARLLAPEL